MGHPIPILWTDATFYSKNLHRNWLVIAFVVWLKCFHGSFVKQRSSLLRTAKCTAPTTTTNRKLNTNWTYAVNTMYRLRNIGAYNLDERKKHTQIVIESKITVVAFFCVVLFYSLHCAFHNPCNILQHMKQVVWKSCCKWLRRELSLCGRA